VEEGVRSRRLLLAAALTLAAGFPLAAEDRPFETNASAEALAREAKAFGLKFPTESGERPAGDAEEAEARARAGLGNWLDDQLRTADDAIGKPPASTLEYLDRRRDALERIVGILERESPEWKRPSKRILGQSSPPEILSSILLHRILVAAALIEERKGRSVEAGRLLEASWSLSQGLRRQGTLISQLVDLGGEKLRVGALRKLRDPSVAWMSRLGGVDPWRRMLDAVAAEGTYSNAMDLTDSPNAFRDALHRAWTATAESLRRRSPCELHSMTAEEIWKPAAEELEGHGGEEGRAELEVIRDNFFPNVTNGIRRSARHLVDRELTLRILELRLEKAGSRDGVWPEKPPTLVSSVCRGESYVYQRLGGGMEIEFPVAVDDPTSGLVLPLKFRTAESSEDRPPRPVEEQP
jgi:hypothetical protein